MFGGVSNGGPLKVKKRQNKASAKMKDEDEDKVSGNASLPSLVEVHATVPFQSMSPPPPALANVIVTSPPLVEKTTDQASLEELVTMAAMNTREFILNNELYSTLMSFFDKREKEEAKSNKLAEDINEMISMNTKLSSENEWTDLETTKAEKERHRAKKARCVAEKRAVIVEKSIIHVNRDFDAMFLEKDKQLTYARIEV
ncbi:hypothetical protein Adt_27421 [Abeliophyllum distichum]|uniref:Uncharacterized protein n=1 Tax=Abeliophyllum distichum TaxID=126358 RepID=A0ABD1RTN6_9LAMI